VLRDVIADRIHAGKYRHRVPSSAALLYATHLAFHNEQLIVLIGAGM
jgi:hypothetical protein